MVDSEKKKWGSKDETEVKKINIYIFAKTYSCVAFTGNLPINFGGDIACFPLVRASLQLLAKEDTPFLL